MSRRRSETAPPRAPGRDAVPVNPAEAAVRAGLAAAMNRVADQLRADNLSTAVRLAQQAACGHGPLVDHFCELGRAWRHLLDAPAKRKRTSLRVVEGGRT